MSSAMHTRSVSALRATPVRSTRARHTVARGGSAVKVVARAPPTLRPRARTAAAVVVAAGGSLMLSTHTAGAAELMLDHNSAMQVYGELAVGLDQGVQLLYLAALLGLLSTGTFLVVRQILVRRELETTAKEVGERVRSGTATGEEFFELGVVLLRKKSYTQAITNLQKALAVWDGEPEEKAQAYNALGFALFMQEKHEAAVEQYKKAVELQSGYVTAWNNLGNAYEKVKKPELALEAYEETLSYDAGNDIAKQRASMLRTRLQRLGKL